ncbi:MAG: hypothetical protein D3906_08320, partial [Candidatus Electrothrix sp. AUS1_2]|nr:hypothetical protein [Candidatus Electrothrix sp. AUS1_2]
MSTVQNTLFYQHHQLIKNCIMPFWVVLLLSSCVPIQPAKEKVPQSGKNNKAISAQAVGHDLEVSLREDAKGSPLALLVQQQMDRYDREQLNHVFERGL